MLDEINWFKVKEEIDGGSSNDDIMKIYSKLNDNVSREIFSNCLLYSLTYDPIFVRKNINTTGTGKQFEQLLMDISDLEPIIYGAGTRGRRLPLIYPEIKWSGYCDCDDRIKEVNGLPIIHINEVTSVNTAPIIISNMLDYNNIKSQLLSAGIDAERIICLEEWYKKMASEQYVEPRCLNGFDKEGIIIDGGAYDGTDTITFSKRWKNEVWSFEPDKNQMSVCKKSCECLEKEGRVHFVSKGLSDKTEKVSFSSESGGLSHVDKKGSDSVECVALDDVLGDQRVAFIKIDIEGYEEKAVEGAKTIIRKYKPNLAIAVYHRRTDIIRLPRLISEINPEYKFSMGHYSIGQVDTVLYAI